MTQMIAKVVQLSRPLFSATCFEELVRATAALNVCQFTVKSDSVCRRLFCWHSRRVFTCFLFCFFFGGGEVLFSILFFVLIFCAFPFAGESNRSQVSLHHKKEVPLSLFNPLCEYILENTAFKFPKGIISKRQRQRGL